MKIKELYKKLIGSEVGDNPYNQRIFAPYEYAAIKTITAVVVDQVFEVLHKSSPELLQQNREEFYVTVKVAVMGTILSLADINADQKIKASSIARSLPKDDIVWQEVRNIVNPLIDKSMSMSEKEKHGE